jgi:hypothetical protein
MDTITTAFISALVAIIGAIISFMTNRRAVRAELRKVEIELTRRLTEKLYDRRLDAYPLAFEITDNLRGEHLFTLEVTREYLEDTRQRLLDWHKKNGILLSDETIETYKKLRRAIAKVTQTDVSLSDETLRPIWQAKNDFRTSMRKDLNLLYVEEKNKASSTKR